MMGTSLTPDTLLKHILSYPEYLYQKEEYSYAFLKNSIKIGLRNPSTGKYYSDRELYTIMIPLS